MLIVHCGAFRNKLAVDNSGSIEKIGIFFTRDIGNLMLYR
jgi:hypothetical protein